MKSLIHFFETISDSLTLYYAKFEDFLTSGEENVDIKVKKKIMTYHLTVMLMHFLLLPLLNPHASIMVTVFHVFLATINFIILKVANHSFIVAYFLLSYLLGLYVASWKYQNLLKVIGLALIQHNHSFLVHDNRFFKPIVIFISWFIIHNSQTKLSNLIEQNEINKLIEIVKGIQNAWPSLYLFNQLCSMHFAKLYCKILDHTKETNKRLERTNADLCKINEKLKSTLSLLEQKNQELADAVRTRELFIASVSHEFRNPLNSMLGNIEILSLEVKDPKWKEMLETCKFSGDALLGLINNVLDVAKINAERLELNYQSVNFSRLIEKVWTASAIKMRAKGLKGNLYIPPDVPPFIKTDSHRLHQILLNLIGNATKFTNTGFVKVEISWHKNASLQDLQAPNQNFLNYVASKKHGHTTNSARKLLSSRQPQSLNLLDLTTVEDFLDSPSRKAKSSAPQRDFTVKTLSDLQMSSRGVRLTEYETKIEQEIGKKYPTTLPDITSGTKEKGILKIEIFDSGCGITDSARNRLFQPFYQADSSITRRFEGTGLGLYITKQLINKMGGEINVYSHENIGTNFSILIPLESTSEERQNSSSCSQYLELSRLNDENSSEIRALVVDDTELNQLIMVHYLKRLNIQADVASNGYEAFEKFQKKGNGYYKFITMDIQMPIMDGLTACKIIRKSEAQNGYQGNIPIIMVTGNCTEFEKDCCLDPQGEIRAASFFRKPFLFEECRSFVQNLLSIQIDN